ncbi:MAG TPA: NUDIX domain-containing protein [Candidatus Limnocylindria bacterium]|nr:NUDIX domain-containing protein [Candidatus Limnocylindria bacterium]
MADLAAILALTPDATEQWHWPTIHQHFDVAGYLTAMEPPLDLVVSVRAIALRGGYVFVFESEGSTHAIPGGRREPGESPDVALVREIREETGCAMVGTPRPLGILHLRSRSPRRIDPRYTYPYPDTLQWVFVAEVGGDGLPSGDPFVDNGRFVSAAETRTLLASPLERLFVEAALAQ